MLTTSKLQSSCYTSSLINSTIHNIHIVLLVTIISRPICYAVGHYPTRVFLFLFYFLVIHQQIKQEKKYEKRGHKKKTRTP